MAMINVRRDNPDPFYRYKMEKLQSKIEGKGNGIKTVIVNLSNVAQALARNPGYVIKYFGFELGAQTNTNPSDDRWIINGAHDASKLQDHLDGFINRFVLCKQCKNPETVFVIKDGRIALDCKACGERSDVDLRLKLSSFIVKNEVSGKKGKKDKGDKKARRAAKQNKENAQNGNGQGHGSGSNSDNAEDDEEDEIVADAASDTELDRIASKAEDIEDTTKEVKDDEWAVDVSEEAVKARAQGLPDDLKQKLAFDEDEDGEEGGASAYDQLGTWVVDTAKEKGDVAKVTDVDIYIKAKELGIETKHRTLTVLAQTIFDDKIASQIETRASMLKKMITSEKHEKAFLGGIERFIGNEHPDLIPQVPKILIPLYQNDLIEEETLKAWGSKASKKYVDAAVSKKVRKAAEPFLRWLEEAESEEEEESGDE